MSVVCDGVTAASIRALEAERGGIDVLINNVASDDRHAVAVVDVDYWEDRMSVSYPTSRCP